MIREHTAFRRLIVSRLLTGAAAIALPFYIIYCRRILELPESVVGSYLSLQMAGSVALIPLWAYLNDRRGPRALLISVAALSLSVPTIAFIATLLPHPTGLGQLAFGFVFFPLAALGSGSFMGYHNYLFSVAPEAHRPIFIGIHNTFFAVTGFLPLLGGVLLRLTSFHVLFALAALLGTTGLAATLRLPAETSRVGN
jgi:Na+/melibiose symporter-like transporter